jgi:multidrug resistance efflux pump
MKLMTENKVKFLATGAIVLIAVAIVVIKYGYYLTNPWTRDGQVHAQVIQIAPRISGPIVNLPIIDNQLVKAGDLLFEIDPSTFKAAVDVAVADVDKAVADAKNADTQLASGRELLEKNSIAELKVDELIAKATIAHESIAQAKATLVTAELDLEFTHVRAPVDGYVTNLNLRLGSQAVANQPALALIDINSYWIHGYFREDRIEGVQQGNRAIVTLMSFPDRPLQGEVDSIGWGIFQQDGSAGQNLLPNISPTFQWIRLAQRVPVRVNLIDPPDDIPLRVGTTASVMVMTGEDSESRKPVPALPKALQ